MKRLILSTLGLMMAISQTVAQECNRKPNEIVSFLEGEWHNYSIFVSNDNAVSKQDYKETMQIKNDSTLTITAHNFRDGENLTKDMVLIILEDSIVMQQGYFKASGKREGNVYYLVGFHEDKVYKFRLYTMGDKYIFHNEVWANGKMEMMNMSYLVRE